VIGGSLGTLDYQQCYFRVFDIIDGYIAHQAAQFAKDAEGLLKSGQDVAVDLCTVDQRPGNPDAEPRQHTPTFRYIRRRPGAPLDPAGLLWPTNDV
jgi:hypothetical protein